MRKLPFIVIFLLSVIAWLVSKPVSTVAQAGDAYALVDAVNQLRRANGLPSLRINSVLMGIAQAHSEYQASIGQVTHTGPGGSRPRDRAAAAGYGGGATFSLSENIAGGTDLSPTTAVEMWQGDSLHWNTMMGTNYQDIGAGAAVSGGFVYYTIDMGYVAGSDSTVPSATPGPGTPSVTPGPSPLPIYAVKTATPKPDGSLVHVVQSGQTLVGIAKVYDIPLEDLLALNGLTRDSVIFPGDELFIRPPFTPMPTDLPTGTATSTRQPTTTRRPTRTPTPEADPQEPTADTLSTGKRATPTPTPSEPASDTVGTILLAAIGVFTVMGVTLMLAGSLLKRRG